jgi:two-component system chemotaxis response regulator CheY
MFLSTTRILVVDDMSTTRMLVIKDLRALGFTEVIEAPDGELAWKLIVQAAANKTPFKLVISAWHMPKLKGIELLSRIRSTGAIAGTSFIMLTAEAESDQVALAMQVGVNGYLLKPFTKDQLTAELQMVYAKRKVA